MSKKKSNGLPPMAPRPIYVEYVAIRTCRYNPSWGRRPGRKESFLWDRWQERHPDDDQAERLDKSVSEPPMPKKAKR